MTRWVMVPRPGDRFDGDMTTDTTDTTVTTQAAVTTEVAGTTEAAEAADATETTETTVADAGTRATAIDHQLVVDGYLACWNTTDPMARDDVMRATWAENAHFVDPLFDVSGYAGLTQLFEAAQTQYPGSTFRQRGGLDAHHDLVRWGWEMLDAAGDVVIDGIDVAVVDTDGRITHLAGFFGYALPAAG